MLIVIYLLYVKLSETIHINRLLGGRHLFLLNKAEKSRKVLIPLIIAINVAIPLKRIDEFSKAYEKYQEYQFAEQYLEPGKTFMVFNLRDQKDVTRLDFFLHEGKRLAANTGAINLKVIQARSPFPVIPIKYIDGKSPFPSIVGTKLSDYFYEIIDPSAYEQQTNVKIDYLLYWGAIEHKMPDSFKDYFKTIEADYRLIATSSGRGLMKIYQRKELETGS